MSRLHARVVEPTELLARLYVGAIFLLCFFDQSYANRPQRDEVQACFRPLNISVELGACIACYGACRLHHVETRVTIPWSSERSSQGCNENVMTR